MSLHTYLYGKNPLKEAILAQKRDNLARIQKLFLTKQGEADPEIMSLVQANKLSYDIITKDEMEHFVGNDAVHQGICAQLDEKLLYTELDEILSNISSDKNSLVVLLNELQDPHNVGAIIRSAVAFGARAILLPEHNQTPINGTVIKSSAGMAFAIPIVRIGNINTTIEKFKKYGFWSYALTGDGDTNLSTTTFDTNVLIVVGSEGEGIAEHTLKVSDFKLSIPMDTRSESLNASNAAAVTMYEWYKQNS